MGLREKILAQARRDGEAFTRLSSAEQRAIRNEIKSVGAWINQTKDH